MLRNRDLAFAIAVIAFSLAPNASGSTFLWASGGLSGSASFTTTPEQVGDGYALVILLQNTAPAAPSSTAQILTGLYFDIVNGPALGMESATATGGILDYANQATPTSGSAGTNICATGSVGSALDPTCGSTVAGGWQVAYNTGGLAGAAKATQQYGIGTSGQGLFNGNSDYAGNANYGIAPGNGVGVVAIDGIKNMLPYVYGSATFVLTGLTSADVQIANVAGVYGTAPESVLASAGSAVPEPGSLPLVLAGFALLAVAAITRRCCANAASRSNRQ